MKLTNKDIINYTQTLNDFKEKFFPQKINFAIIKNLKILNEEYQVYIDSLNKIFNTYQEYYTYNNGRAITDNLGIPTLSNPEKQKELTNDISELLNIEIEVFLFLIDENYFDYDDMERYSVLTPQELSKLMNIIAE